MGLSSREGMGHPMGTPELVGFGPTPLREGGGCGWKERFEEGEDKKGLHWTEILSRSCVWTLRNPPPQIPNLGVRTLTQCSCPSGLKNKKRPGGDELTRSFLEDVEELWGPVFNTGSIAGLLDLIASQSTATALPLPPFSFSFGGGDRPAASWEPAPCFFYPAPSLPHNEIPSVNTGFMGGLSALADPLPPPHPEGGGRC